MTKSVLIESLLFLRKLRIRPVLNCILLRIGYCIALITKKIVHTGKPMAISIEPTTRCNLACVECINGSGKLMRPKGDITWELFKTIINNNYLNISFLNLFFQGEPFLHSSIFDFVNYAHKHKIFVQISTNGHFINSLNINKIIESGLDKIIISLDGVTNCTYQKYRKNGNIDKVLEGIELLCKYKKQNKLIKPYVEIQYLVTKANEHELPEFRKIVSIYKPDSYKIKTLQVQNLYTGKELLPLNNSLSRYYTDKNNILRPKSKLPNKCWRLWSTLVFTWDGRILPCCYDKNANFELGNVTEKEVYSNSFKQNYKQFIYRILQNRKQISICNNCTEGLNKK